MNVVFYVLCCLSVAIGIYLFTTSLTEDIKNDLIAFSDNIKLERNQKELFKQLFHFIQFYSTVKGLVCKWSAFTQPMILILFVTNLITICVSMLLIQMEMVSLTVE